MEWSEEIEAWLPGQEHDPSDYDTPCGESGFDFVRTAGAATDTTPWGSEREGHA